MIPCYFTLEELEFIKYCVEYTDCDEAPIIKLRDRILENLEGKIRIFE
jgi:hypothetical protein